MTHLSRKVRLSAALACSLFAGTAGAAQSCREEAGAKEAQTYVEQCLEVSAATHPPCNADNPCKLIFDEIIRGCEALGDDAPDFCDDYSW